MAKPTDDGTRTCRVLMMHWRQATTPTGRTRSFRTFRSADTYLAISMVGEKELSWFFAWKQAARRGSA